MNIGFQIKIPSDFWGNVPSKPSNCAVGSHVHKYDAFMKQQSCDTKLA